MPRRTFELDGVSYPVEGWDTQRQKAYDAENAALRSDKETKIGDGSMEALEREVKRIVATKSWERISRRFAKRLVTEVPIHDGAGHRSAKGGPGGITMPRWARTMPVLLHELAHVLTWPRGRHHWPWTMCFLELVRRFMGREAAARLRAEFKKRGVRTAPRRPRAMSEETRQMLRERCRQFAAARKARQSDSTNNTNGDQR